MEFSGVYNSSRVVSKLAIAEMARKELDGVRKTSCVV
jgi:hypothetical protein